MKWLKLYHDFRGKIALNSFNHHEKWAFVILQILASESSNRGTIECDRDDIAPELDMSLDDLNLFLERLQKKELIEISEDSAISIANWDRDQHVKPSDRPEATRLRKQQQRARQRQQESASQTNVTPVTRDSGRDLSLSLSSSTSSSNSLDLEDARAGEVTRDSERDSIPLWVLNDETDEFSNYLASTIDRPIRVAHGMADAWIAKANRDPQTLEQLRPHYKRFQKTGISLRAMESQTEMNANYLREAWEAH